MLLYLSVCAARHSYAGPTNCCRLCLVRRRDELSIPASRAINLLFEVLSTRARRGNQAAGDGLAYTTVLFVQNNPRLIFHFPPRLSARLSLRGPTQNLLGCLLRSHERRYGNRQLRRNEPYPHARRIHHRFMIASQPVVILRGTGHVLGPKSWQSRAKQNI